MNEVEISIKGLVFYVLKHWKSILVAGLIGAILLGGFKAARVATVSANPSNEESELDLTYQEKEYVESIYNNMNTLRQLNADRSDSIILKIDPENAVRKELVYVVSASNPQIIGEIIQTYGQLMTGLGFCNYVSEQTGLDYYDIVETVSVSYEKRGEDTTASALTVKILSDDESRVEEVASAAKKYIADKGKELEKSGFEHDLILLSEDAYCGYDYDILTMQSGIISDIQNRNRTIIDTEAGLEGDKKTYYEKLGSEVGAPVETTADVSPLRTMPKFIVLGIVFGVFMACGIYCVIYVFANKIDEDDDTESVFGMSLIGIIPGTDYGKMLYKLRHFGKRTFDFDESINLISSQIEMLALKENITRVGVVGCGLKKNSGKAAEELTNSLKKHGIESIIIDDPLYDPSGVKMLKEIKNIIILEKIGVTYRTEVLNEKELAEKLGIKLEGIVLAG